MNELEKEMLKAIRDDGKVGDNTCSAISECMTDGEVVEQLRTAGAASVNDALKWAYEDEGLFLEKGLGIVAESGEPIPDFWKEDFKAELAALEEG